MSLLGPQLEAFLAITRIRTVVGASRELGITQTGVTQRIRALESELDTTLFTRSRQGMRLTHEGEALLRYCETARDLEGETLAKIKGAGGSAPVRVAIVGPTSILRARLVPAWLPVLKASPELLVSFEISDTRSGAESLRNGTAQFAVLPVSDVAREFDSKVLKPEHYVLVGTRAWKGRSLKDIVARERIVDFDASDEMTRAYLKKYRLLDLARPDRHFVNNNESLLEMFREGLGYGVLTREFADLYSKRHSIIELNPGNGIENRLALAWYPRPILPEYFRKIIAAAV